MDRVEKESVVREARFCITGIGDDTYCTDQHTLSAEMAMPYRNRAPRNVLSTAGENSRHDDDDDVRTPYPQSVRRPERKRQKKKEEKKIYADASNDEPDSEHDSVADDEAATA